MQCTANIQNFSEKFAVHCKFYPFLYIFAAHCIFTLHIYWLKPSNSLNKGTGNVGGCNQADA